MERRVRFSRLLLIFFIFFLIWFLLQIIAPLSFEQGSVVNLSGSTIMADNSLKYNNMDFPFNYVYRIGDSLCHQRQDRSFLINDNQMPFCSRCTGIWIGIVLSLGIVSFYKFELDEKFLYLIFILLAPMAVDGIGQLFGFWESTNLIRVITGVLGGVLTGLSIGFIIDELRTIDFVKS